MADRIHGSQFVTRSEVLAKNGMVAASQPLAAQAGLNLLRAGGNAVDAAIAVNACLGLMEPTGCGIGGDLFVLLHDAKSNQLHALNGSGRSAGGSTIEDMQKAVSTAGLRLIPTKGPLSISIPGCVDGWFELHRKFGKLDMSEVLAPAIHYAVEGFPVSEVIAHYWEQSIPLRQEFPGFMETFSVDGRRAPAKGEIWRNQDLANAYKLIAKEGPEAFYRGKMSHIMADFLEKHGSFLRYQDFASHHSDWVEPVSTNYRGYDIWELPPNGQGLAVLQILNILEGYDIAGMGFGSADHIHAFVEAKKLAFADRATQYADPKFFDIPIKRLLSKDYAASQRARIEPGRAAQQLIPNPPEISKGDTVYLCTADSEGNMVSLIQSNYHGIGSGLCPPGLGFGFQTRGSAFSLNPCHANAYTGGKRPFHTIIPAFITQNGIPLCAFGVMGGDTQPQAHAQIVMNLVDFHMNLQEAGDAPRMVHSGDSDPNGSIMSDGGCLGLENGFAEEVRHELMQRGHLIKPATGEFGGYQAIWRDPQTGVYAGASESRKDGHAVGW